MPDTAAKPNILQYGSRIWATADLLRDCGIKESDWPSPMMPFFALVMLESRLLRMVDELKVESRFQVDSKIEHGNTLTDDKFLDQQIKGLEDTLSP